MGEVGEVRVGGDGEGDMEIHCVLRRRRRDAGDALRDVHRCAGVL